MDPVPASTAAAQLRFGRFELQVHERRLLVDGEPVALGGRAFDVLLALAERPGRLVSKNALMDLVWPNVVVQENNLAAQVSAVRKVVGEEVIATIPGRGYRFIARIESAAVLPPAAIVASPPSLRTNLPVELPALLGRGSELAALGALVDTHRLVTVVGAGGIGKSLLTQHLLASRRDTYPQGICWVELAQVTEAAALPGAVATALGVEGGNGDPLAVLIAAVAPLQMLLALDNAEHMLEGVANLARALHEAAPGLRVVVTSQAPLKVSAERVFRVDPLAVPGEALSAGEAMRFGAVALFVERAHALDTRFALTDSSAAVVIELCRALDGLPLAIELAAARAPLLGVQALLGSMRDRLLLLTSSRNRDAPARQQTLRAALEWSHGLLPPREQQVFRRLGVMAGSASLGLIRQVVADADAGGGLDAWAVLDALDVLVDRSLVTVLPARDGGEPRYRLLESPRAYALELLDRAGEREALQRRHALAMASMFDAAYDDYYTGRIGVDDWALERAADFDNARDALHWARGARDAEVELRICCTLLRALPFSLHAERMALADACEARVGAPVPAWLQLRTWIELNCVLADTRKQRGRHAAENALRLARELERSEANRFVLYHALCRAASAAAQTDGLAYARTLLPEIQAIEDPAWPAQRLVWGSEAAQWIARMSGDADQALQLGRRLLMLDRARGSDAVIAAGNLVDAELAAGDPQSAARTGAALVEALLATRHEYSLAFARINLLAAVLALDDLVQARAIAPVAWEKAVIFSSQHAAAVYVALLAALDGRPRSAARIVGYSDALYAARKEARERNETAAAERAEAMARRALGAAEFERLHAAGAGLGDADIAAIAFGGADE